MENYTLTPEQEQMRIDVLAECYASTEKFAKMFFPERFHREFSPYIHKPIFDLIDSGAQKIAIAAPRGVGKTSICNLAIPAKGILFQDYHYIVHVSCSATAACDQSDNLKHELEANEFILKHFGSVKSDEWAKDRWTSKTGTRVLPRGAGQQIRGLLYRNYRPGLIIVDDLEDPESMDSEEQRKKKKEWFFADLMNSVDKGSDDWRIVYLGTVLHEDSLLLNLLEDDEWQSVRLEICDDNFKSKWPEFWSDVQVVKEYNAFKKQGQADVFFREYRNLPISTEDATFKISYFKYYEEKDIDFRSPFMDTFILVDPAKSVTLQSADSAIVGVTIDSLNNIIYQRDLVVDMFYPDKLYEEMFAMAERLKAVVLGVEVTSLNEFITYPIRNEIIRRGLHLELVELKARGKKEERIAALVPFYRMGQIFHNKTNCAILESQLLSFPRSKKLDAMDAFAYAIEMLEMGGRYFSLKGESEDNIEKEFSDLYAEDEKEPLLPDYNLV